MSERQNTISTGTRDMFVVVQERLKELRRPQSIDSLKQLFWKDLSYDRASEPLSYRNWPDSIKESLFENEPLLLFATGGKDEDFDIIYIHLASDELLLGQERPIVMKLLENHLDALFIFSNAAQDKWHFVNVKSDNTQSKRRLFRRITVGPEERLRTASERLALLDLTTWEQASRLDIRQLHEVAFDVEAVTKRFFEEYKVLFRILEIDLRKQTDDAAWAHDYALQFLNRCMFLYFIQRKGWLGSDKEFLCSFWDSYKKTDHEKDEFFENWLKVLFFEAFNNRFHGGHRYFPENIQNILATAPYLNGGLFSQNKLDTGHTFTITDARFEQVYTFFERFNFTISEDSPLDQEVAVDPEMIGKVYESLVNVSTEADERGDAGIFYTPRTEIDLMCRLAVVDYLSNHLGQDKKNVLYDAVFALEPNEKSSADDALTVMGLWEPLSELLRDITVVDPACGSGSFLVGMLYVLDDLQDRVNQHFYDQEDPYTRKKRIIGQSLYGVDVMEWAAHIAELRLWLALIIDAEISHPEDLHVRVDPLLPHLSFKVRFGDSLVQEIGGINMSHTKTNIVLFSAPSQRPGTEELNNIARFIMFKVTFERVLAADIFRQIERTQERTTTPEYRINPVTQMTLLEEGFKQPVAEEDTSIDTPERGVTSRPLVKEAHAAYTANKWGGRYLRAPDIYWTILEKGKGKLVRLEDIAEVRLAIKTGANEFFFLDNTKARQWKIEEEFLQPVIKNSRESKSILIHPNTLKSRLFLCHKTKEELKGTAALEYIKWGESQAFHMRPSCAGRTRWWDLGIRRSPYLGFNYLIDTTAKTLYAPEGCYFSNNFQEVHVPIQSVLPLCASLNSTVFQLMVNVAGRSNFGDGLLKIETYELSDLLCLNPLAIDFNNSDIFSSTFWDVLSRSSERRTLDDIIFDALNLTQGERDAVYEGVIELVEARLNKAKSLKVSQERRKRLEAVDKTLGIWIGLPEEENEGEVESHYA